MRERLYRVDAIVLKRTDHGEADRLLTLLTPDQGKLRASAKGVRKPTSRKSGHVELFTHCALMLAQGKTFDVVTQADTVDAFIDLRDNLDRVGYAYYIGELIDRFAEEGTESRALFDLLLNTLRQLAEPAINPDLLARFFELRLLDLAGYRPQLFNCIHCGNPVQPVENFFSAEAGGVLDPDCKQALPQIRDAQTISVNALKVLRYLQSNEWTTVRGLRLATDVMTQVERLLHSYIVYHLERNLKSVEFLHELKARVYATQK